MPMRLPQGTLSWRLPQATSAEDRKLEKRDVKYTKVIKLKDGLSIKVQAEA